MIRVSSPTKGLALEKINATRVFFVERGRGQGASVNVEQSRRVVFSNYGMVMPPLLSGMGGKKKTVLCSI